MVSDDFELEVQSQVYTLSSETVALFIAAKFHEMTQKETNNNIIIN